MKVFLRVTNLVVLGQDYLVLKLEHLIQSWDMINAYRVSFAIGLSMERNFGPLCLNYVVYVKNAFSFMIASFHLWIENILTTLRGLNFDLAMNIIRRIEQYFFMAWVWSSYSSILPPCILFKKILWVG